MLRSRIDRITSSSFIDRFISGDDAEKEKARKQLNFLKRSLFTKRNGKNQRIRFNSK